MKERNKKCITCGKRKEIIMFPLRKDTGKTRNECKSCTSIRSGNSVRNIEKECPWLKTFHRIKSRCGNFRYYKNVKCLITKDELRLLWIRDSALDMKKPSIDRIDSKGDYSINNCRYIELEENILRAHKGVRYAPRRQK